MSELVEDVGARIFGIQSLQFAQNFFGALVLHFGNNDLNLDDLIATLTFTRCAGHALLAHAQLLPGLCSGRNLELCAAGMVTVAVDGGHLNACAERGLHRGDRYGDVNVVRDAAEELVMAYADDEVEISRGRALGACVAFAGEANALAVARAGLDAKLGRLDACDDTGPVASGAAILHLAAASAARALNVELHAAAGLLHLARAVALGALHGLADRAGAFACRAWRLALNLEARDAAANRGPEVELDLVLEVGAGLRSARLTAFAVEHTAEDVLEAGAEAARL